jgi:hypothetical protein
MPKYTKLLPPHEYEKLTLDEKSEYIIGMSELLRPRVEPLAPPDTNPTPDDKPKDDSNPQDDKPKADLNPPDDKPKADPDPPDDKPKTRKRP